MSLNMLLHTMQKRYWLSNALLILLGVLLANGISNYIYYQQALKKQKTELAEISYNILGLLNFNQGQLQTYMDTDAANQARSLLEHYGLDRWNPYQFAYMLDTTKKTIIWVANTEPNFNGQNQLLQFPFTSLNKSTDTTYLPYYQQLKPMNAEAILQQDPHYQAYYPYKYLISILDIQQQPYGAFKLIVGRSLSSLHADFHQFWTQVLIASSLLILVLFLGYYYLSRWLLKPLTQLTTNSESLVPE